MAVHGSRCTYRKAAELSSNTGLFLFRQRAAVLYREGSAALKKPGAANREIVTIPLHVQML